MSDRSGGFFSSVGRFFAGNKSDKDSQHSATSSPVSPSSSTSPRSSKPGSTFLKDIMSIDSKIDSSSKRHGNNLRFLSPSVLDSSARKVDKSILEIDVDPVTDIFSSPSVSLTRKRQLTETDRSLLTQTFGNTSVKRTRFPGNRSLLEPNLKALVSPKLDTTWCGQFSASHSPNSSVTGYSLLSRRSGNVSNGSNLSSSTQQFLRKLEQANTPAKEVQRMTSIRAGLSRPERWAPSNSSFSSDAPPLRKAGDNIPSRIQLLSKSMAFSSQRKPYWRDLTRKRSDPKFSDVTTLSTVSGKTNGSSTSTELSSLFQTINNKDEGHEKVELPVKKHHSTIKGSDGKAVGKNTFKLLDDEADDGIDAVSEIWKNNVKPPTLNTETAPQSGFLGKMSFSFAPPTDLVPVTHSVVTSEVGSDNDDDDENEESSSDNKEYESKNDSSPKSSSDEKSSDESDDSESSDSDSDESQKTANKDSLLKPVESRPQTSTDTVSPAVSLDSSKNSSPKNAVVEPSVTSKVTEVKTKDTGADWTCDGCFTSWPGATTECGCCGQAKGGASTTSAPPQKNLVSNLSSFGSSKPSGVSFGFGSTAPVQAPPAADKSSITFGAPATKPLFGTGITPSIAITKPTDPIIPTVTADSKTAPVSIASTPVVPPPPSASSDRVAWDCPDCMVNNKSTDDKCVCCGFVKYKSADSSSNVFGAMAFKPSSNTGTLFGTGSLSTAPKFGFGVSSETKSQTTEVAKPAVAPVSFGIPAPSTKESTTTPGNLFGLSKPLDADANKAPLPAFGTGINLFGSSKPETTSSETAKTIPFGIPAASNLEKKDTPLFGTSLSTNTAPAPAPAVSTSNTLSVPSFGTGSIFGNTAIPSTTKETTLPSVLGAPKLMFGQPSSEPAKTTGSLFGNLTSGLNTVTPSTSTAGSLSTTSLFGAGSSSNNIFGNAKTQPFFGSDSMGTTTTDGAAPAKKSMFSNISEVRAPSLSFGGMDKTSAPVTTNTPSAPFVFQSSAPNPTAPSLTFGSSTGSFGGFGASNSTQFGNSSSAVNNFGAPSAAPAFNSSSNTLSTFGNFGGSQAIPPLQPTISNSSSTSSLFNLNPPAATDMSNPFQAGPSNGFNFGGSAPSNTDGVFKFGSSANPPPPTVPNGSAFQFSGGSSTGGADMFSYQPANSAGGRKMATARRRNLRK